MAYSEVFGAQPIYSAQPALLDLALTADVTLDWPLETVSGPNVLATIVDVTPNAPGRVISMPDARQGTPGYAVTFSNLGADTFTVEDVGGNVLLTVASGLSWTIYLRTNVTANGTWHTFQQGAGASAANAAALAGAGLKAITTTLNTKMAVNAQNVNYVLVDGDRAKAVTWTGAGIGQFTLPSPAVVGTDWYASVKNAGGGSLTIVPTLGLVDGAASLTLAPGDSAIFYTDGTNFYTVGRGRMVTSTFDFTAINVAGTGNYTLAGTELNRISYRLTGILTGNRSIIVPSSLQEYWVDNQTSGAFTLTVKTAAGSGVVVQQGTSNVLYCDGVNVVDASRIDGRTLLAANGTAALPSYSFLSDPDTGLYRIGANNVGLALNGVLSVDFSAVRANFAGVIYGPDGAVGAPTHSFTNDTDTGMFLGAANTLSLAAGGGTRLNISTVSIIPFLNILGIDGTAGAPSYSFNSDPDTGLYRIGANNIGLAHSGVLVASWGGGSSTYGIRDADVVFEMNETDQGADGKIWWVRVAGGNLQIQTRTDAGGAGQNLILATRSTTTIGTVDVGGTQWRFPDGSAGSPVLAFGNDNDTGLYRDTANQIAIALGGVTAGQIAQGSFTGTLTGCTTSPTATFNWQRVGNTVTLWCSGGLSATSNATTMTITGAPAVIRPSATVNAVGHNDGVDNTVVCMLRTQMLAAGTLTFTRMTVSGANIVDGAFTAAGTKGIGTQFTVVYPIA